jgi:GWxTD domain-containing protein
VTADAAYIISNEELRVFRTLRSDAERELFIELFWQRRDPTPNTEQNEAKDEHYRRIRWANEHYGNGSVPGWRTEQGKTYIQLGPPDEIRKKSANGNEQWRYKEIPGLREDIAIEFSAMPALGTSATSGSGSGVGAGIRDGSGAGVKSGANVGVAVETRRTGRTRTIGSTPAPR